MSYAYEASWATEPYFYRAPWPEQALAERIPPIRVHEFQLAGVEYAVQRSHALIGDAPGLGKSAQGVLISNAMEAKATLVVCPASLRLNWEREVCMWSTIENVSTYPILKAKGGFAEAADYVIVSYDMLRNNDIFAALMDRQWDHLILDEAHYLKDPKGNLRTKRVCGWMDEGIERFGLADVCDRITMLSGTILPNQPIECYNAIRLLNWEAINCVSLEIFRETYYEEGWGMVLKPVLCHDKDGNEYTKRTLHRGRVRNQPVNLDDLQLRLRGNIMVRRTRDQVLKELPPMRWHPFPLAITPDMRRAMAHPGWKEAERLWEMDLHAFDGGVPVDGAISTARRLLGEAKAKPVADYIEDLLASGVTKLVVAAHHRSVLAYLRKRLEKYGLVYMDGSTPQKRKQDAVDAFQLNDQVRISLGQVLTIGEGWTLTEAQDVVDAEPDWRPGVNDQLLYRVSRMGQKGSYTLGHLPIVPGTLDERIVGSAVGKDRNIYKALDAPL